MLWYLCCMFWSWSLTYSSNRRRFRAELWSRHGEDVCNVRLRVSCHKNGSSFERYICIYMYVVGWMIALDGHCLANVGSSFKEASYR